MLALTAILLALSGSALGGRVEGPGGEGFFAGGEVDFWGARRKPAPPAEVWTDSSAPPPVRRLLENPSAETARGYLAWQTERFRRLRAATEAVEDLQPKGILYFAREGCGWCEKQEAELHGLPVIRVPAGSASWEQHGVAVTPTMVVKGRVFRGFTPRAALMEAMGR